MAYWGFGTKANKIAWALVVLSVVIGTAFWIPGVLTYRRCLSDFGRCVCRSNATSGAFRCLDPSNPSDGPALTVCNAALSRCRRTPVSIWAIGWLFLAGLCWVPCLYFCCCSRPPGAIAYQPDSSLQMAPVAQAGQHYGLQPFAAQPYGAPPFNYQQQPQGNYYYPSGGVQQQQQQSQPMPGYPVEPPQTGVPVHRY